MAFPPPYPNPMMPPPGFQIQPRQSAGPFMMGQKFGFFSPQTSHRPRIPTVGGVPMIPRQMRPYRPRFPKKSQQNQAQSNGSSIPTPVTTIFVGNITDKCHDSVVQDILRKCGTVCNWKRLQDSNGKFKAFGFCDFMHPDGARKALRILKDLPLGDKRLNVKADEDTEKFLEEFASNRAKLLGIEEDNPPEAEIEESDDAIKDAIKKIIEEKAPELLEFTAEEVDASKIRDDSENTKVTDVKRSTDSDVTTKISSKRKRSRSSSRDQKRHSSKSKHHRKQSPESRSARKRSSNSPFGNSTDSSSNDSEKSGSKKKKERHRKNKKESRKRSLSSENSDEEADKRRLKKELKEREESYLSRLKKWEDREKRMARQYAKDEEAEVQRQKTISREAKKLRQFLEDYQDERDDPKYYKGTALFERRRNYEREREADAKDKHEERKQMEELKKMIMKENKMENKEREQQTKIEQLDERRNEILNEFSMELGQNNNDVYTPPIPTTVATSSGSPSEELIETETVMATNVTLNEITAESSSSPAPVKIVTTLQQKTITKTLNGVFEEDDEEEDTLHQIKKKIKPFEITREDRIQSLTPEERKKLIKELIGRIPTNRDELFSFTISWEYLDDSLMDQRVRPWINKKICEYIGEEEISLVSFICEKITERTAPDDILQDLSMVLDEEADVFMVKLWRLIVYESEAKRLGLNVLPVLTTSNVRK